MNRVEFWICYRTSEKERLITIYNDVAGVVSFLNRQRRISNYSIAAFKGERGIKIDKIESEVDLLKKLNDFQNS